MDDDKTAAEESLDELNAAAQRLLENTTEDNAKAFGNIAQGHDWSDRCKSRGTFEIHNDFGAIGFLTGQSRIIARKLLESIVVFLGFPNEANQKSLRDATQDYFDSQGKENPVKQIRKLLTTRQCRLFDYLRSRRERTEYKAIRRDQKIHEAFQGDDPSDEAINKALKRMQERFNKNEFAVRCVFMTVGKDYVNLELRFPEST